jgi:hypothetical protein
VEITVAEAQSVQDTHKEVLALTYGEKAVILYKVKQIFKEKSSSFIQNAGKPKY